MSKNRSFRSLADLNSVAMHSKPTHAVKPATRLPGDDVVHGPIDAPVSENDWKIVYEIDGYVVAEGYSSKREVEVAISRMRNANELVGLNQDGLDKLWEKIANRENAQTHALNDKTDAEVGPSTFTITPTSAVATEEVISDETDSGDVSSEDAYSVNAVPVEDSTLENNFAEMVANAPSLEEEVENDILFGEEDEPAVDAFYVMHVQTVDGESEENSVTVFEGPFETRGAAETFVMEYTNNIEINLEIIDAAELNIRASVMLAALLPDETELVYTAPTDDYSDDISDETMDALRELVKNEVEDPEYEYANTIAEAVKEAFQFARDAEDEAAQNFDEEMYNDHAPSTDGHFADRENAPTTADSDPFHVAMWHMANAPDDLEDIAVEPELEAQAETDTPLDDIETMPALENADDEGMEFNMANMSREQVLAEIRRFYSLTGNKAPLELSWSRMTDAQLAEHLYLLRVNNGGSLQIAEIVSGVENYYRAFIRSDSFKQKLELLAAKASDQIRAYQKLESVMGSDVTISGVKFSEYSAMLRNATANISSLNEYIFSIAEKMNISVPVDAYMPNDLHVPVVAGMPSDPRIAMHVLSIFSVQIDKFYIQLEASNAAAAENNTTINALTTQVRSLKETNDHLVKSLAETNATWEKRVAEAHFIIKADNGSVLSKIDADKPLGSADDLDLRGLNKDREPLRLNTKRQAFELARRLMNGKRFANRKLSVFRISEMLETE